MQNAHPRLRNRIVATSLPRSRFHFVTQLPFPSLSIITRGVNLATINENSFADLRTIRTFETRKKEGEGERRGERKGNLSCANWEQSDDLNG